MNTGIAIKIAILAAVSATVIILAMMTAIPEGEESFPAIHIDTENGSEIVSKDDYITCTVDLLGDDQELDDEPAKIKGRGNTTWNSPKKPYSLKFDSKTDVLGMKAAKKWVLVCNYFDQSLSRNYLASLVADTLDCSSNMDCRFVHLYINGEYRGLYLLSEKIEIGKNRVDVKDPEGRMAFIVEMDIHAPEEGVEGTDYFLVNKMPYTVKDPECTPEQVEAIKNDMQSAWKGITSGNWNEVEKYIDPESFASSYILHELFSNEDVGRSSFYLYMAEDSKLYSGPAWDLDRTAGNGNRYYSLLPDHMYAAETNVWYSELLEYPEFREIVISKLAESTEPIKKSLEEGKSFILDHKEDFYKNFNRWNVIGTVISGSPEQAVIMHWEEHVDLVLDLLNKKLDAMTEVYSNSLS